MKVFLSVLVLSACFLWVSPVMAASAKSDAQIAQRQCRPMEMSGQKEKTICSIALSVILARTQRNFCQRGEVCIAQTGAFSKETLGRALYVLERDLPKNNYKLKISAALLYPKINRRLAANSDENSVSQLAMFLSPYVTNN